MPPRITTTSGKSGKPAARTAAGKTAATKTGAARPATTKPRSKVKKSGLVSPVDRLRFIAEAAYYRAEKRGFAGGDALRDWIEAEAEIAALLDSRGAG